MFDAFKKIFFGLKEKEKKRLIKFLNSGKSLVGEYVDGMHIIPLKDKERPTIKFFGVTSNTSNYDEESDEIKNLYTMIGQINSLGLPAVSSENFSYSELEQKNNAVLASTELEGYVDHFFQGGQWIGSSKHKMPWYVLLRALREKMANSGNIPDKIQIKALVDKKDKFLHMSSDIKDDLTNKLIFFSDALREKKFDTENLAYSETDFQMGIGNLYKKTVINPEKYDEKGIVIFFNGVSGMGKDTIGGAMETLDRQFIRLNQDQFLDHENTNDKARIHNAKKLCMSCAIKEAEKGFIPVICRNNQTPQEFKDFISKFRGRA